MPLCLNFSLHFVQPPKHLNFVLNSQLIKKLDVSRIDCLKLEMYQLVQLINLGHDALASELQYVEFSMKQTK